MGETAEEQKKRRDKWKLEKWFGTYMRQSHRFIRGQYNPKTKEIEDV